MPEKLVQIYDRFAFYPSNVTSITTSNYPDTGVYTITVSFSGYEYGAIHAEFESEEERRKSFKEVVRQINEKNDS